MNDPRGDASGGTVFFPTDQVIDCQAIIVRGGTGFDDPIEMDGVFGATSGSGAPSADFGVMQMVAEAPTAYVPLPIERFNVSEVGDPALCLSHPARLPLKGEAEALVEVDLVGGTVDLDCYGLGGSSGGGVVNLRTGMLAGVMRSALYPFEPGNNDPPGCLNPCFTCSHQVTAVRSQEAGYWIPPIGLELSPATTALDYYGPLTSSPGDYPERSLTVRAPIDSRPVDWNYFGDTWFVPAIQQLTGPGSGTLNPENEESLSFAVTSNYIQTQGVTEYPTQFFDTTYETSAPVLHRIHAGIDGFGATPIDDFVGEGPGALPGDRIQYGIDNRWIVDQDITVTVDSSWIVVTDEYPPFGPTLPPLFTNFYTVDVDPTGLQTGIHLGVITWESLDSGTPSFTESRGVRFDVGRHISGITSPEILTLDITDPVQFVDVVWSGPTTDITDADIAVGLSVRPLQKGPPIRVKMSVLSPDGTEVILESALSIGGIDVIYDDETYPPKPPEDLDDFIDKDPSGTWRLRFERLNEDAEVTVNRFEVRLHVD